ncbi:MAG: GvpL/GvpF family gas vesicle protein [Candidatus Omnitrophica bacterium]|nr:GvpL/GvpF family gas vesicle protein [Candidatus Omnitrophota bacterium]
METGKYIYCIIGTDKDMKYGLSRINDFESEVYTIRYKDIAACVSDSPIMDYRPTHKNILAHTQAIEKIMQDFTVLPLSFGTVSKSEIDIEKLLEKSYEELRVKLEKMKDKIEVNIMAIWKEDGIQKEAEERHSNILKIRDKMMAKPQAATMNARVALGEKTERAVSKWRQDYKKEICNMFKECVEDFRFNKIINITMILNTAFLVRKDREKEFDKKVNELGKRYGYKIKFRYSGPFPPYNFVDIKLKPG